jgi:hypothetical protein
MNSIYYIYAYIRDSGIPYYIGRGKKSRAYGRHIRSNNIDFRPKDKSKIIFLEKNLTKEESINLEKYYIAKYGRKEFGGILINIKEGGEDIKDWTPEMRKKMSIIASKRIFSKKTRLKMSIARKNIKPNLNSIIKMVNTRKLRNNFKHTKETKLKLSISHQGLFSGAKNPMARKVFVYDKGNNYIGEFDTGREAVTKLNLYKNAWKHIPESCKGKRIISGYKFSYTYK